MGSRRCQTSFDFAIAVGQEACARAHPLVEPRRPSSDAFTEFRTDRYRQEARAPLQGGADGAPLPWPAVSGRFHILSFGCQMNQHDAQKMANLLHHDGWTRADAAEAADLVVIHTCSIR